MKNTISYGIHPDAKRNINSDFSAQEKAIALYWGKEWYVTNAGHVKSGKSEYNYMLVKATSNSAETLGLSREIVVIFSRYTVFEPRTLDAYERVYESFQDIRCERICYVLISADENIENALLSCLSSQESQIIVPFSYLSFDSVPTDSYFLHNQFRRYFHSRDLFDFSDPLKKDYYFFGRNDIVVEIIGKHKANQNYGLFGLRKAGKTSIIYDVLRKAPLRDSIGVFIDCQDTSFNMRRWNHALYYVINCVKTEAKSTLFIKEEDFTETDAATQFKNALLSINGVLSKTILIMFDEIENITYGKSSAEHWCKELDFVYFWQSIRSAFQTTSSVFSFCIMGTNPKCVEDSTIKGKDNPIFNAFQPKYIPGFNIEQTREMVNKLGQLMGIRFDEGVFTRLAEEYGGHPFLIRRICSAISQTYPTRPISIDRTKYNTVREKFNRETEYFKMLLEVLTQFYPDEYEMLNMLAFEDYETFNFFASNDPSFTKHLIGYGIIVNVGDKYDFRIDSLRDFLIRISERKSPLKTKEEKWAYTCVQRNKLELELRRVVRITLKTAHKTEGDAKNHVIGKIYGKNARKYANFSYADLFDSRKSEIYLKNILSLFNANWDYFSDYFGDQQLFNQALSILNHEGRFDAHATIPDDNELMMIEGAVSKIRKGIEKFNELIV